MMHTLLIALFIISLAGCATDPGLYQWGGYENDLYAAYKDTTQVEKLRINLETHTMLMEKNGQKVAPGLYAELGTLYLQSGALTKAIIMYKKERDVWPESKGLMSAMIQNLERRQKAKQEIKI
ncbi:MAG: DUF4810 domain-containing protein [Bdellovibrionia bacterium]